MAIDIHIIIMLDLVTMPSVKDMMLGSGYF